MIVSWRDRPQAGARNNNFSFQKFKIRGGVAVVKKYFWGKVLLLKLKICITNYVQTNLIYPSIYYCLRVIASLPAMNFLRYVSVDNYPLYDTFYLDSQPRSLPASSLDEILLDSIQNKEIMFFLVWQSLAAAVLASKQWTDHIQI